MSRKLVYILSIAFCLFISLSNLSAQTSPLTQARVFADQKEFAKAAELYQKIYDQDPLDADVYNEYLMVLLADKKYKEAEKLVERQIDTRKPNGLLLIDLGNVFLASGKEKKATEQFDKSIDFINGDDMLTTRMANSFTQLGKDEYAIRVFERAKEILRNPFLYGAPLARLYAKTGAIDKAVNALLDVGPSMMPGTGGIEDTKATMLELLGTDAKKLQQAQKTIIKRINEQPENNFFSELLTWLYTQRDDWEGALIQIEALDARNKDNGARLIEFARTAKKENQLGIAIKTLDAVIEKGKEEPMYAVARAEKLNVLMLQLKSNIAFTAEDVSKLGKEYEAFFSEAPDYYNTETLKEYAALEAQYANNPEKGIALLEKAIRNPGSGKIFAGWAKLQLGDYYILIGKIWDASLIYSQVDKAFREDQLGEEARFRNAKLAYYRGDFEWAQGQLSVLKASTSELIANDALYLSVLITENIPPDSNLTPLLRFAHADLLLFQNKDKDAETVLDSIAQAFPKHPLTDDILMLRSKIAQRHREYEKALGYLKEIYEKYGKDVLGDDAVFKTAEINEKWLKKPDEAKKFYEQLIVDYPGSTYIQSARARLTQLQENPVLP